MIANHDFQQDNELNNFFTSIDNYKNKLYSIGKLYTRHYKDSNEKQNILQDTINLTQSVFGAGSRVILLQKMLMFLASDFKINQKYFTHAVRGNSRENAKQKSLIQKVLHLHCPDEASKNIKDLISELNQKNINKEDIISETEIADIQNHLKNVIKCLNNILDDKSLKELQKEFESNKDFYCYLFMATAFVTIGMIIVSTLGIAGFFAAPALLFSIAHLVSFVIGGTAAAITLQERKHYAAKANLFGTFFDERNRNYTDINQQLLINEWQIDKEVTYALMSKLP